MHQKKEIYLDAFRDDLNYNILDELYKRYDSAFDEHVRTVFSQPLLLNKPMNPYVAGGIGSAIGGTVAGGLAAYGAIEKKKAYDQNIRDVAEARAKMNVTGTMLEECYVNIESLINQNEVTREDWKKEKGRIKEELNKKYIVR